MDQPPDTSSPIVTALLRRLIALYGYLVGALNVCIWGAVKLTVRIRHVDQPGNFACQSTVDCAWHENLIPYFAGAMRYRKPYAWMNHPAWYMKGVHVFLGWMGVGTLALGSSGHGGRRALEQLVPLIRQGASTFINPDGPYGPSRQVKDGVLDLAQQTGCPVVAIRIDCRASLRLPTWDRKHLPLPGSRVEFIYSPPWQVTATNREVVREMIRCHLSGEPQPTPPPDSAPGRRGGGT